MICSSVIPCLSNGLAKNDKIRSMFVLFSWLFGHFEGLAFFSKIEGHTLHQSSQAWYLSQFLKDTMIK